MKKRLIIILAVIFLIGLLSFVFDAQISRFSVLIRNDVLTKIFLGFTVASHIILILVFLTSLFLWKKSKRKWIFPLWITLAISAIIAYLLKIIIKRQRPFYDVSGVSIPKLLAASYLTKIGLFVRDSSFSFPSMHSFIVFAVYPIISKEFPRFRWYWLGFAVLVALSRVYLGVHYLSDIIFGGLIGYLIGLWIFKTYKNIFKKDKR